MQSVTEAFARWDSAAALEDGSGQAAAQLPNGCIPAGMIKKRMLVQGLTEAFMEWREAAAYQKEVQGKLAGCLQRWRLNLLAAAFDAFCDNVVKQRQAKLVRSAISEKKKKSLCR